MGKEAYLYLVKSPSSNDVFECASDSKFYPGTYVVAPSRYGQDIGVIIGNAGGEREKDSKECACIRGACHLKPEAMREVPKYGFKWEKGIPEENEAEFDESCLWDAAYSEPELSEIDDDIPWIAHMATPDEIKHYQENIEAEKEAVKICREKIEKHNLDMKLVAAHFLLCEPKVLFFFTAEERVDFRELVKDLVTVFKMRIELRQIGVRDESRVLGGLSVCGRDFCCHGVSDKLDPVTIKMAKEQNLSLNSMKISGPCGRLLCCLSFENEFYVEEKQSYPNEGTKLKIGPDFFKVTEINILTKKVIVTGEEGQTITIPRDQIFFSEKNSRWEISRSFQDDFLSN